MVGTVVGKRLKENYDSYYQGPESLWRKIGAEAKVANIVALCHDIPHGTILEIGAGEGAILQRLANLEFGQRLYALEISESGVESIRQRNLPQIVGCHLFDGYAIPYSGLTFDLAILSHVLEHVEHPRQLLYEASRVARYVFVEVPLEDTIRLPNEYRFDKLGHINFYSPKTIRLQMQTSGLEVLRQTVTNPSSACYQYRCGSQGTIRYMVKELLLKLLPGLATNIFTYHTSLLCTMRN